MRVIESADYHQLLNADELCECGSGEITKKCHPLNMEGILSRWKHPDGDACQYCPHCIALPALTQLGKIANHLELIKPDSSMSEEQFQKQADFARMAFGRPNADSVTRDRTFWTQSHGSSCGKMRALAELLRIWKRQKAKVLLFSLSTQMLDILEDFVTREGCASQGAAIVCTPLSPLLHAPSSLTICPTSRARRERRPRAAVCVHAQLLFRAARRLHLSCAAHRARQEVQ
jgi:hypothetical protein